MGENMEPITGDEAMRAQMDYAPMPAHAVCEGFPLNPCDCESDWHEPANCSGTPDSSPLPSDAAERKRIPLCTGLLDYFPDALIEVAKCSMIGNEQHNPGEKLHWAREKSTDQEDCLVRHLIERGKIDSDGIRHTAKMAWRALACLQLEIESSR